MPSGPPTVFESPGVSAFLTVHRSIRGYRSSGAAWGMPHPVSLGLTPTRLCSIGLQVPGWQEPNHLSQEFCLAVSPFLYHTHSPPLRRPEQGSWAILLPQKGAEEPRGGRCHAPLPSPMTSLLQASFLQGPRASPEVPSHPECLCHLSTTLRSSCELCPWADPDILDRIKPPLLPTSEG